MKNIKQQLSACLKQTAQMEQKGANTLVLHTESNNPGPLYYALRQCFENLEIEES